MINIKKLKYFIQNIRRLEELRSLRSINGLQLLIVPRASRLNLTGTDINSITDFYDENKIFSQSPSPTTRPGFLTGILNNRNAINFVRASQQQLQGNNAVLSALNSAQGIIVTMCIRSASNNILGRILNFATAASAGATRFGIRTTAAGRIDVTGRRLDTDSLVSVSSPSSVNTSNYQIWSVIYTPSTAQVQFRLNGADDGSPISFSTAGASMSAASSLFVGLGGFYNTTGFNNEYYNGEIAALAMVVGTPDVAIAETMERTFNTIFNVY